MNNFKKLYELCKKSQTNFIIVVIRFIYYKLVYKKTIIAHEKVNIDGVKNIETKNKLYVGVRENSLLHKSDVTNLHVEGKMIFHDNYSIGRGCRITVGKDAVVELQRGSVNINTKFVINTGLKMGKDTIISWNCQLLDDDLHHLEYEGKKEKDPTIVIGDHVWIGCNVTILKGVHIANNCVIAANSMVSSSFHEENCLIAGNPAKVIKRDIGWKA